eukprot:scaffold289368_cov47-Prasinocladus_malaysianus.AAC.1
MMQHEVRSSSANSMEVPMTSQDDASGGRMGRRRSKIINDTKYDDCYVHTLGVCGFHSHEVQQRLHANPVLLPDMPTH